MKVKTINAVLAKKFNEFLDSITDATVRNLVRDNSIITGGCIASMLLKEDVNDFDIYFTNKQTTKAVAEYYLAQFNANNGTKGYVLDGATVTETERYEAGGAGLNLTPDRVKIIFPSVGVAKEDGVFEHEDVIEEFPDTPTVKEDETKAKYRPIYVSSNAITLSNKVQIIIRFYGSPDDIHLHYDYIHCTNYWLSKDRKLTLKQPALEALLSRTLVYVGSKYPIASLIRTRKFIKRGWSINAGQYLKIAFQVSRLDLCNIEVLEDQLTGVDVAYFNTLIDAINTKQKDCATKGENWTLEYGYLSTLIDKIF